MGPAASGSRSDSRDGTHLAPPALQPSPDTEHWSRTAEAQRASAGPAATTMEPGEVFRGRVVDVVTREGVFGAAVRMGRAQAITDLEGFFDLGLTLSPDLDVARVMNSCQGTHIRDAPRETWELQPDGSWVLPISIGPTFRLRLEAGHLLQAELWRARVVEVSPQGVEHHWDWAELCEGDPRWFRYDNPQEPTYPGPSLRLEVLTESGLFRGSAEVAYSVAGLHPHVPTIYANEPLALLLGVVIDGRGEPLEGIEVQAIRVDEPALDLESMARLRVETTRYGDFELPALAPGDYDLRFRDARGAEVRLENVSVPAGETTLADVVLEQATRVGSIRGRLVAEGQIRAQLRLRAIDAPHFEAFDTVQPPGPFWGIPIPMERSGSSSSFQFNDLPAGEYELEVLPLDGRAWSPRSMRVSAPAEGLVFTREEEQAEAFFHVVDAETGREFEEFLLQLHPAELFTPHSHRHASDDPVSLVPGRPFRWIVYLPDYAPAHGDAGDFHDQGGRLVATVRLSPGWGATLVFRDHGDLLDGGGTEPWTTYLRPVESPPVPGVVVTADGQEAGTSDARGVVHVRLDREPTRIEFRAPGWIVFESEQFQGGRLVGDAREVVIWLARR